MPDFHMTQAGRRLAYVKTAGTAPGIVFRGGFKSDMQGTKAVFLEDWARARGHAFLRFDYSGNGQSSGAFEEGCIGDWAADAQAMIEARFSALVSVPKAILRGVWRVVRSLALTLGILMLILCGLGVWSAIEVGDAVAPKRPGNMVLSLHLNGELPETTGMAQVLAMIQMDKAPATIDAVVDAIDRGAKEPAVKALAVKADGGGYNLSQLQSLRAVVLRFKASGKKTVIFSESYGEGGYGLGCIIWRRSLMKSGCSLSE